MTCVSLSAWLLCGLQGDVNIACGRNLKELPTESHPLLLENLRAAKKDHAEDFANLLELPYERRFGEYSGRYRFQGLNPDDS